MEELLIGNSLIILFWVYITFIVDVTEKTKVIVLMYLITFITNIFNVVPTKESYVILIIALFIQFEFFEDNFKKIIITNWFDKMLDFLYIVLFQYSFLFFTLSLVVSSGFVVELFPNKFRVLAYAVSIIFFCVACDGAASKKYVIKSFGAIKNKIDSIKDYRKFLESEKEIVDSRCVLFVEDANFYNREDKYTFLSTFYLKKKYFKRLWEYIVRFCTEKNRIDNVKKFARGYSTIEMQLLRTLAIQEGYDYIFRRKIYEILYSRLFWKNLRQYYARCGCGIKQYKDFLLYLYLRTAPCLNVGREKRVSDKIKPRSEILEYSREELFALTLCFSGKVKRRNVIEIYEDIIELLELDIMEVERIVCELNI